MPRYRQMKVTVEIEIEIHGADGDGVVLDKALDPIKAIEIDGKHPVVKWATVAEK